MNIKAIFTKMFAGFTQEKAFVSAQNTRQTSDWIVSPIKTNEELKRSLQLIVLRARDLAKNNPLVIKYLNMRAENIIGSGFKTQIKIKNDNKTIDFQASEIVENGWYKWGRASNKFCTMDGTTGFVDFCKLIDRTLAVDGECFIQLFKGLKNNPYKFSLRIIDTLDIDVFYNVSALDNQGNYILMGVERDKYDRPVAYWTRENPVNPTYFGGNRIRLDASNVIHLFHKEYAGQVRGISALQSVMLDLNMLNGYKEAELYAARAAACQMAVIEQSAGTTPVKILSDNKSGKDGQQKAPEAPVFEMEPGAILNLPMGKTLKQLNPTHPGVNYDGFTKEIKREIACGLNLFYNSFAADYVSVTYSSFRAGALTERAAWIQAQEFIIENVIEVIFTAWLEMFLLSGNAKSVDGKIVLPFSKIDKYNKPVFKGIRWPNVDPLKEKQANILDMNNGLKSQITIMKESGLEPEHELDNFVEFDKMKEARKFSTNADKTLEIQAAQYSLALPSEADEIEFDEDEDSDED